MPYSDFSLEKVKQDFSLTLIETKNLFAQVEEREPSVYLKMTLDEYLPLATAINTEKSRSEFIIAPVLAEVRRQARHQISLFSGSEFNVDRDRGLAGYCDYLLSGSPEQFFITAPVVMIAEAKNENIKGGLGQCIASMVAAQIFNEKAHGIQKVYGAVTSGTVWRFVTLDGERVCIDSKEYYIDRVDKILGILLSFFFSTDAP